MTVSSKRPVHVAVVSLILSVVFFGISFFLGRWSGFLAISAVGWLNLSVALIWLVLCLQFYQRSLAEQEKLDAGQLSKDQATSTIFQAGGERATLFYVAQRRLQIFEKWFIPLFSALIAAYQIGIGLYLLSAARTAISPDVLKQPLLCGICMTAIAFVSFLMSRYATGMSAQPEWKPLRAGGSALLGAALLCFVLAIALALAYLFSFKDPGSRYAFINIMARVIPGLLVVLGIETALNLILDIYRPRLKGLYSRSAFDSRLLGVINEPGGILRSAADAIDYQFGFQVSQTWFYKLLEQWIVPLALFACATLYFLSCIVVVAPDEEAIIEHFGNPADSAKDVRLIGPGLTFKWPWPIDKVYTVPTKRIAEISIGFVPERNPKTGALEHKPLLWGESHYAQEYQLLVASEQSGTESFQGTVPVSLVIAAVPVQYRIKDLYSFVYNHREPEELLESICYRELTRFAASAKIEVGEEAGMAGSLLGAGRTKAAETLTTRIQKAADEAGLGVEIVFVGVQGIHPPVQVAADYQRVIGALQKKQATILQAQAERNKTLSNLVGSVQEADALYQLWLKYQKAVEVKSAADVETLGAMLDDAFKQAKGDIFKTLRESEKDAFEKATLAEATGEEFAGQLKAYQAAPQIYIHEQQMATFEEALDGVRKYVVVTEPNDTQTTIIDLQEKLAPNLYELGGIQESSEQ